MDWFTTFIAWLKRLSPLRALEHGAWLIAHSIVVEFTDAATGRLRADVDTACFALVDRCLRKAHQALDLLVLARAHQRLGREWRPLFRATRLDQDLRAGPFDPARLLVRARPAGPAGEA